MLARIYRPAKTAMQSGKAKTKEWVLEFEPASARLPDRLMGWAQSSDMEGQVRLTFDDRDSAPFLEEKMQLAPAELVVRAPAPAG